MRPFGKSEYEERVRRTKVVMEEKGIDVLIVSDPANMNYLTGYDAWSWYVHQAVIVGIDAAEPIWIGRGMDAPSASLTTFLSPESIVPYPDDYVENEVKHPMQIVADLIERHGWKQATIGVESDAYYFTAKAQDQLRASLPAATFTDAYLLVSWLRGIKSPQELEYMRQAARITERAMQVGIDAIEPGVRECDAAAEISRAQIQGVDGYGGDYPVAYPFILAGEKAGTPHSAWSDEPFQRDTAILIEEGGCRFRYSAGLARSVYLGTPPDELTKLVEAVGEGLEATLGAIRPGNVCEDVEAAWRITISRHRLEKESRIGYAIGADYPPAWNERTASLRPGDTTLLEPNMTFHVILGMWMDRWGYVLSETVRVSESGAEVITNFPRQLFVKP